MEKKRIYWIISCIYLAIYGIAVFFVLKTFLSSSRFYSGGVTFIQFLVFITAIIGTVIFISSKFKRSNLIRIIMCMNIMSAPFNIAWFIFSLIKRNSSDYGTSSIEWTFYLSLFISVIILASSCIGLRMLSLDKIARLSYYDDAGERTGQFFPANAGLRFANYLVDAVLIFYVFFTTLSSFLILLRNTVDFSKELIILIEVPYLLLYYIVMEAVFNTTAGKCATGTTIVNENGQRPNFGQVMIRTFSRFIPFEAFSFFAAGARGWHDTFSKTYVVESINKEDAELEDIILDAELNIFES
ncbi:MAG: RDD family protein [Bacteroidetes bacterium]|nr:RDD family protein [Bacteroidota bacterium]